MTILDDLAPWRSLVDDALRAHLSTFVDVDGTRSPPRLRDAMNHAVLAGGKRLRPLVCLAVAEALYRNDDTDTDTAGTIALSLALPAAVALELVHTYSLVHDDLPSLDDDDLRRGRPTVHKAFDEGTAVLVGDGLLTDAFAVLARAKYVPAQQVLELALAAGSAGMVAGQHDDMQSEGRALSEQSFEALREIHRQKTGRLFAASAALGALAANRADVVDAARAWGAAVGFAFQVQDDIIDVEGDAEKGGKGLGRDEKHNKLTTVRALGLDGAKALAARARDAAVDAARALCVGRDPERLVALSQFAVARNH